jgi:hypothetical protein
MELTYHTPKLKYGYNPPAVYKMIFDTGHFYIGSSKAVKTRFVLWRTSLNRMNFASKIIADVLPLVTSISFEIVEVVPEVELKTVETHYIQQHIGNPLLLNRSPTAFDNSGIKPLPPHLIKPRSKKRYFYEYQKPKGPFVPPDGYVWLGSKKINQYRLDGEFVAQHSSISVAAQAVGVNSRTIQRHLRIKRVRGVSGFVFRLANEDQSFIVNRRGQ